MEDAYLHEIAIKNKVIKNIDGYIDYYLDTLAWYEGNHMPYVPEVLEGCQIGEIYE